VQITKTSQISGQEHTMDLPVTQAEIDRWKKTGAHVQNVFPHLNADQREFLMTGITPEEWEATFGGDDE